MKIYIGYGYGGIEVPDVELKPCPFCGGKAKIRTRQQKFYGQNYEGVKKIRRSAYAACNRCHAHGGLYTWISYDDSLREEYPVAYEAAAELWNRRDMK